MRESPPNRAPPPVRWAGGGPPTRRASGRGVDAARRELCLAEELAAVDINWMCVVRMPVFEYAPLDMRRRAHRPLD